jgi:hypothetical protein
VNEQSRAGVNERSRAGVSRFDGKVGIVTGAARGIGKAYARALAGQIVNVDGGLVFR